MRINYRAEEKASKVCQTDWLKASHPRSEVFKTIVTLVSEFGKLINTLYDKEGVKYRCTNKHSYKQMYEVSFAFWIE